MKSPYFFSPSLTGFASLWSTLHDFMSASETKGQLAFYPTLFRSGERNSNKKYDFGRNQYQSK